MIALARRGPLGPRRLLVSPLADLPEFRGMAPGVLKRLRGKGD